MESFNCIVRLTTLSVTPVTTVTNNIISKLHVDKEGKRGEGSRILGIISAFVE